MPRQGPVMPYVGFRIDPTEVDAEAAAETERLGRPVQRSEMIRTLIEEALAARALRAHREARAAQV
jgi:hypothetical protein